MFAAILQITRAAVLKAAANRPHIEVLPVISSDNSGKDSKLHRTATAATTAATTAAAAAKHATSTVVPVEGIQPTSGYNKYMRRVTDERRRHQELHSTVNNAFFLTSVCYTCTWYNFSHVVVTKRPE
jgi:uncharacterized protein (UPF0333 family)